MLVNELAARNLRCTYREYNKETTSGGPSSPFVAQKVIQSNHTLAVALGLPSGAALSRCVPPASPEEAARVLRGGPLPAHLASAAPRRRTQFLAGRHCASQALTAGAAAAGVATPEVIVGTGEDDLPAWPAGWTGSISHTDGMAVAVVAPTTLCAALGIDVEPWIEPARAARLADAIALPEDVARVAAVAALTPAAALTLLFSAKEALYKALYPEVRHYFGFDAARLHACGQGWLELVLTRHWHPRWPAGTVLRLGVASDHIHVYCALCLRQDKG